MKKSFLLLVMFLPVILPAQVVSPFELKDVKLLPSRFQHNMQRDSIWIASIPVRSLLHSFRNTAGVFSDKEGGYMTMQHLGGWESMDCDLRGHITGHLLSAMAYLQMTEKADSIVQGLAEVQRQYGTGYLSAFGEGLIDRNIQGKSVWAPFYTLHKIMQGLIDQYVMCGNTTALDVARGMGDWAYNKLYSLDEKTRQRMLRNEFGGFNEAMYNLYAITHDEKHLWVARFFYHNDKIDPLKVAAQKSVMRGADLGTNHANTFIPKLLGECRNYELFGEEDSRRAATLLFNTLVNEHAFVTGEVSDKEHLFKPETQSKHLTGYDGENCCTYNLLKLADRLFCYQPDSRIADYYERALYNHILGQQDTISSMVCYFTPLQTGAYRLLSTRDSSFWCCVGSGFESHAKYQAGIYYRKEKNNSENDRELYINMYIPSEVTWDDVMVRQETRFPEDKIVRLTVSNHHALILKLRYPYWATFMKVNGKKVKADKEGYVVISQESSVNANVATTITVELGMQLHEEATKDDKSRVALMYGPIVLAGRLDDVQNPFSNPKKYNDYYTFDYGKHDDVELQPLTHLGGLRFRTRNGIDVGPFYNMQRCRYVVYWKR